MQWTLLRKLSISLLIVLAFSIAFIKCTAVAANGSATYTYDFLGRVTSVNYDTGAIVYYFYDANGNRTQQTVNVNTQPLCLNTSAHSNPVTWGAGQWSQNVPGGC
ncbi:RHS repeat domain-containing protein [Nitrospirillum sp. BR 11163]|uniref:RHS repeat domain-containing protein n=1 Tax=Nitrospirillum sp. BR 11163 TaxID=3104323 RepID=UPI002AFF4D19|nr:RHS repeat domain-containing protein [Nitrospirillum sp. BR 11163]MEA1677478.1 RHS repeat domain-containing protein [Nitrospirillum sp. BR 11163]